MKRNAVIDLTSQINIEIDLEQLLKQKAFKQHQRRIDYATFGQFIGDIEFAKQLVEWFPIDNMIQLFKDHHRMGFVSMFFGSQVSKRKVTFRFYVYHKAPKSM